MKDWDLFEMKLFLVFSQQYFPLLSSAIGTAGQFHDQLYDFMVFVGASKKYWNYPRTPS